VKVNGKPLLACELLVENAVAYFNTTTFTIEPIDVAPVIRDLVVDIEKAYQKVEFVKPYVIDPAVPSNEGKLNSITPHELEYYINATRCINCFCCASACISSSNHFLGPNAMLACIVRMMDPREQEKEQRKNVLYSDAGVSRCHSAEACSHVCPKEIDVAHFIALAKAGRFKAND
jgi:succinate dehydrogenase / fumarate reductase iron-sulfur subunit